MDKQIKTYTFHVKGMHCKSCVLLTENELSGVPGVESVKCHLNTCTAVVKGDFGNMAPEEVSRELSKKIVEHGYSLLVEAPEKEVAWYEFSTAIPAAIVFVLFLVALQKFGLINLVSSGNVTYGTAFAVGIVASLSTCMAVVGGLVLSMSATFAKEGDKVKPQALFHLGRLISFFILGGVIGALGSAFEMTASASFVLGIIIGIVMLVLGINLLDVFHFAKKLQPSMPKFLSKHALGVSRFNHTFTPFLVGVATFFLPCGFTQSMQIYTLSTGNFITGGLTMLSFALGTLPVLAALSFSSWSIGKSGKSGVFFKTAGIIVILFALFNIINSFVIIGLIKPVFNF